MSRDSVSQGKSLHKISIKKIGSGFNLGLSVSDVSSSKFIRSNNEESISKGGRSDITFILRDEINPKKIRALTVTKCVKKTSRPDSKEEIAKYILEHILSLIRVSIDKRSSDSTYEGNSITKLPKVLTKKVFNIKEDCSKRTGLLINQEYNETNHEKNDVRRLESIVEDLQLPIDLPKSKRYPQINPKLERIVFDTHISLSSVLSVKPQEKTAINKDTLSSTTFPNDGNEQMGKETLSSTSPFDLCWCFGFNPEVPILNLSNNESSLIVFANSQYAVLYDFHEETMSFMQGHINTVSCITASLTGCVVATADSGSQAGTSRVIVWDRRPCVLQVIDNAHPYGCQRIGLSSNGELLVTVSAKETPVCIKVWEWRKNREQASASIIMKGSLGHIKTLTIHGRSKKEFAVTFEQSVVFAHVTWQTVLHEGGFQDVSYTTDCITDCSYHISEPLPLKLGSLTDTTFLEYDESTALSSTRMGYVILWESRVNKKLKRSHKKYVRLHLDCITNIKTVDNKIAVATTSGNVSFYDLGLQILYFHKLKESLVSLSFNLTTQESRAKACEEHDSCAKLWRKEPRKLVDATLKSEPFLARHFVFSTETGKIAYFNVSCGIPQYLLLTSKVPFTALDMMPSDKFLCAGTASGQCILLDTESRTVKVSRKIKTRKNLCHAISFLKYSPSGYVLACAMYTGDIWLLDPFLLTPTIESPLSECKCCITQIEYTSDSKYLIVTDVSFCISAYVLNEKPTLIGQFIAHYSSINQIVVIDDVDKGGQDIFVLTVSKDHSFCLFKIDTEKKDLHFIYNQRIEQSAIPMCCVYYPQPYISAGGYLGVSNEHKFRLFEVPPLREMLTASVKIRGKFQAPDYGSSIEYMDIFENNSQSYIFFKTKHHIGIHLLPVDGNPYRALGYRASPTDITCCRVHPNGKYVFTISESCCGLSMWKINTQAVEDHHKSGGEGLIPFLKILGKEKESDIQEFFNLGQILHEGESPCLIRTLRNSLPICEVANVLQALGCLLTRQDIKDLTEELVTRELDNPHYVDYVDFVRLFFNHRSTCDIKIKELRQAFRDFYNCVYYTSHSPSITDPVSDPVFDFASFIYKLQEAGEKITLEELIADFSILTGVQFEISKDKNSFQIPTNMPNEISFETFVRSILGLTVDDLVFGEERFLEKISKTP